MKNSKFHYKWNNFLLEGDEMLLLEARIKDVKAKYPKLDRAGWLNWHRRHLEHSLGTKGISKYLMWIMRELHQNFKEDIIDVNNEEEFHKFGNDNDVLEISEVLLDIIMKFERNQQRLEEKNIYKYNAAQLQGALERLEPTRSEKDKRKKRAAEEGSDIIYDDNQIFAVRPTTKQASCYYGMNTRWCISATQSKNYFNQYTKDNAAFVMVKIDKIPASDNRHKLALVFDEDGDIAEVYDASDAEHGTDYLYRVLVDGADIDSQEAADINSDILHNSRNSITENPPDVTQAYEEEAIELENQFRDKIKNAWYSHFVDGGFFFSGGFEFELEKDTFDGAPSAWNPSEWSSQHIITTEIANKLQSGGFWSLNEITIDSYNENIIFRMEVSTNEYEDNPNGYEAFLEEVESIDKEYDKIKRIIIKYLIDAGFMVKNPFFIFFEEEAEELSSTLQNLKSRQWDEEGEEEVIYESKERFSIEIATEYLSYITTPVTAGYTAVANFKYISQDIREEVIENLQALNRKFIEDAAKQLELPFSDLASKITEDISIPDTFNIEFFEGDSFDGKVPATAKIVLSIDDINSSHEFIESLKSLVKLIDAEHENIKNIINNTVKEKVDIIIELENNNYERLSEVHKELLAHAKGIIDRYSGASGTWASEKGPLQSALGNIKHWARRSTSSNPASKSLEKNIDGYFRSLIATIIRHDTANVTNANDEEKIKKLKSWIPHMPIIGTPSAASHYQDHGDDDVLEEVQSYFSVLKEKYERRGKCVYKKTGEKKGCSKTVSKAKKYLKALYANSEDINEDVDNYISSLSAESDSKDEMIKNRKYELADLMDPDFNPWNMAVGE